jgi:hypothetical protein
MRDERSALILRERIERGTTCHRPRPISRTTDRWAGVDATLGATGSFRNACRDPPTRGPADWSQTIPYLVRTWVHI